MKQKKLIILSDILGVIQSDWIKHYTNQLTPLLSVKFYDVRVLADIDLLITAKELIHKQFVEGGIEKAIENLIALEKEEVNILAFSIGGTIAWKSTLRGLESASLTLVSSTRLRKETEKPNCKLNMYFGEKDKFKPNDEWFSKLNIEGTIFNNEGHEIYKEKSFAETICNTIKTQLQ